MNTEELQIKLKNTETALEYLRSKMHKLADRLATIQDIVNEQAEDEGLWFEAETAPEAYVQRELRRLHEIIEREI